MSATSLLASGVLGGATTKFTRTVTRRALHDRSGVPRLPRATRHRHGLGAMLAWAAAVGVFLAVADVMMEQRRTSAPGA